MNYYKQEVREMQERRQGFAPPAYRPLIAVESTAPESEVRKAGAAHNNQKHHGADRALAA